MEKKRTARTIRLTEQDHEAILSLKEYYGLTSENEVIRMALPMALREMQRALSPSPAKPPAEGRIPPHV